MLNRSNTIAYIEIDTKDGGLVKQIFYDEFEFLFLFIMFSSANKYAAEVVCCLRFIEGRCACERIQSHRIR